MRKGYTWLPLEPELPEHTQPSAVPPVSASGADSPEPSSEGEEALTRSTDCAEQWLFVRGEESIRITRDPGATTLLVFGPGSLQNSHEFESAAALEEFRQSYEQRVLSNGWVLLDVGDRRASGRNL